MNPSCKSNELWLEFGAVYKKANELLPECRGDMEQVIALETEKGKIVCKRIAALSPDEDELIDDLKHEIIVRIVCLWGNGGLDMPSHRFRKKIYENNVRNGSAEMLLMGTNNMISKPLLHTIFQN